MLQLLYHSLITKLSTPQFFFIFIHLNILLYSFTASSSSMCISHEFTTLRNCWPFGTAFNRQRNWWRLRLRACVRAKGHYELWQHWVRGHWSSEAMFQILRIYFFKSVNNSLSYHKSLAQLCHQELVEQLQHVQTSMFHTVVQRGFYELAKNIICIL